MQRTGRTALRNAILALAVGLAHAACSSSAAERGVVAVPGTWQLGTALVFTGACDASGGVGLPGGRMAVADDEDNVVRIYDLSRAGEPVERIDTGLLVAGHRTQPEMDLEGSATLDGRVYFIASHGRKKSGKAAPGRLRLLAADVVSSEGAGRLALVGRPYGALLEDLAAAPALARYRFDRAAERSPSAPGGLNIEGLTDSPEGHLVLGFRSPVPGGRALLVPITNPAAMVEVGERAAFGEPVEIDLGGRGVRSVATWDGAYWIVGGAAAGSPVEPRLYRWDGSGPATWLQAVRFGDLNPEGIAAVTVNGRTGLLLLSDDGERAIDGQRCKKLKDPSRKRFRAAWLQKAP